MIADHFAFGEAWDSTDCHQMCDVCRDKEEGSSSSLRSLDAAAEYLSPCMEVLETARRADTRLTALRLVNCLVGRGETALRPRGGGYEVKGRSRAEVELVLAAFLLEGYVKEEFSFTPYKTNSYIVEGPKAGFRGDLLLKIPKEIERKKEKSGSKKRKEPRDTAQKGKKAKNSESSSVPEIVDLDSDEDFVL